MKRLSTVLHCAIILSVSSVIAIGQSPSGSRANHNCAFGGTYRVNVAQSDQLYSVVKEAASAVPIDDQQQFFTDLSTRLTPPDILAIECQGQRVSIGSSRASKVTYLADGRTRRERGASGNLVNARIEMKSDSLTFISEGKADDSVNVTFEAVKGESLLRVTRRIFAAPLAETLTIRTVYDRIDERVAWNNFDGRDRGVQNSPPAVDREALGGANNVREFANELRTALSEWIDATNRRDIPAQMTFYSPVLTAYYLSRNTPRGDVLVEKKRIFDRATTVDIRAAQPEMIFQDGGETVVMRFVKDYRIVARGRTKSGSVVQELRWRRYNDEWRIFSERDIRVIR